MMKNHRRLSASALAALLLVLLAIGVSACGSGNPREVEEGEVVTVGKLEYTVVFSRYLNENDAEDVAYLQGQPPIKDDHNYFGVFLQVFNPNHSSFNVVPVLTITDSTGKRYKALPSESEYAFPFSSILTENEKIPEDDSSAQSGPIVGSVAIFDLPEEVSSNRPLLLHIPGPTGESGTVKLDL
ncbi:MAG TPA: hypothetical protein VGC32_10630 [Solirubrobacterales bacterium]